MCKVEGGLLRNENGVAHALPYDGMSLVERQTAMAAGFMFWDSDNVALNASPAAATSGVKIGNIINCAYPGKNFKGGATTEPGVSSWQDVFSNKIYFKTKSASDTLDFTSEYLVPTTQSILSLHQAGYIEYLPFKSRMSPFYDNRWQHWYVLLLFFLFVKKIILFCLSQKSYIFNFSFSSRTLFFFFSNTHIYITGQQLTKVQDLVFLVWEQQL